MIIHSAHPIPGLRVDELVYDAADHADYNARMAADAEALILNARDELLTSGHTISHAAVARVARAHRGTVARVLAGFVAHCAPP